MNKVILIGNLTKDPEISTTSNGVSVCRFSVAVSRRYTNNEGERDADFFNIVAWRALGENCHKFLRKGSKAAIVGSLQTRSYESEGTKRYVTEVVADEVEFISTKSFDNDSKKEEEVTKLEPIDDDNDLPF
jgi:single-strand DNA-binding protein